MRIATPVDLIITNTSNQILLVRRAKSEDRFKGSWSFPGGGPKSGERFEETLKREIKEEIDCLIESMTFFRTYKYKASESLMVQARYYYGRISGTVKLNKELSEFRWFNPEDIEDIDMAFNQKDVIKDFIREVLRR